MKIVDIYNRKLWSLQYEDQLINEFQRLQILWADTEYVMNFLKDNQGDVPRGRPLTDLAYEIIEDADDLVTKLIQMTKSSERSLDKFFRPLYNEEFRVRVLSLRKARQHWVRLYAIRIDVDCFVITGGAIKLTDKMDRPHLQQELVKLNRVKAYFAEEGVGDHDSFYELLTEE